MTVSISRRGVMQGAAAGLVAAAAPVRAAGPTAQKPIRLHLNENPYGPSDGAKQAMQAALDDGWMYDNEDVVLLRRMIAAKEGVKPENVFICEGSTELLRVAGMIFGGGREVVAGLPTFTSMMQYAARSGGTIKWVNLDADKRLDLKGMEARVGENTGAVYVCNPNNPTGTIVDTVLLRDFIGSVAPRALVLVDEAYIDLVDDPAGTSVVDQVKAGVNVLIARTFSKIHGMAGLRVGYGLARPDIIRKLEERRMSVPNRMGLKAAIASYEDTAFLSFSRKMVRASAAFTADFFKSMKLAYTPTQANFMIFDSGASSVAFATALRAKFILVNPLFEPYDTWVRVTMGRLEDMEAFAAATREHFRKA
jgi:histidinol-phosphate aminotransferase